MADIDESYGDVTARYYDAAYAALGALGPDADFYRRVARRVDGPVLELGCGTGRVLLPIAADGLPCVGVDPSRAMLDALRSKAGANVPELVCARMQDFDLGERRFALIYSAFRAFQHLLTVEDQLACLERVRRHLLPDGLLAFDVFQPRLERFAQLEEPEHEDVRFHQDGEEIVRTVAVRRDNPSQRIDVTFHYERRRDGRSLGSGTARLSMRWFLRYELEHLLARAGFGPVNVYGDFDGSPVGPDSPALVVVAGRG